MEESITCLISSSWMWMPLLLSPKNGTRSQVTAKKTPAEKKPTRDQYVSKSDLKEAVAECMKDGLKEVLKGTVNEYMETSLAEFKSELEQVNIKLRNADVRQDERDGG